MKGVEAAERARTLIWVQVKESLDVINRFIQRYFTSIQRGLFALKMDLLDLMNSTSTLRLSPVYSIEQILGHEA